MIGLRQYNDALHIDMLGDVFDRILEKERNFGRANTIMDEEHRVIFVKIYPISKLLDI